MSQPSTAMPVRTQHLPAIQWLRAFAAISVAIGHILHEATKIRDASTAIERIGSALPFQIGVDIFFVISGFIMVYVTWGKLDRPGAHWHFLRARLIRIVPIYWFYTLLLAAVALTVPSVLDTAVFSVKQLLSSLLFIPGLFGADARPLLKLGWTLNYEMFFYAVFFLGILFGGHRTPWVVFIGLLSVIFARQLGWLSTLPWQVWAEPIILEFCFGMGIGVLYHRGLRLRPLAAACLVAFAVVMLTLTLPNFAWATRYWVLGVPSAFLVLAVACLQRSSDMRIGAFGRFCAWVGDASYTLYLMHPFVISAIFIIWRKLDFDGWSYVGVTLAVIIGGALVAYHLIEIPLTAAGRRFAGFVTRRRHPATQG
jgi:exopolysaccharide production protein ExoZ